jgi:hypothetical protein
MNARKYYRGSGKLANAHSALFMQPNRSQFNISGLYVLLYFCLPPPPPPPRAARAWLSSLSTGSSVLRQQHGLFFFLLPCPCHMPHATCLLWQLLWPGFDLTLAQVPWPLLLLSARCKAQAHSSKRLHGTLLSKCVNSLVLFGYFWLIFFGLR